MKRLVTLMVGLCCMAVAEPAWKQDANKTLELVDGDTTLVRFRLAVAPLDPHFEVLATADGRNTVWVGPPDHVWHYGLWFSWKKINGVNFWETDRKQRRQQGLNVVHDPRISCEPEGDSATIHYRERSHPDPKGPAVLEDEVEIHVFKPAGDHGVQVEWRIVTTALADVVLGRTPPPGEPGGKGWGGYGGFSWRGAQDFKQVRYLDSEGRGDEATHRQHAAWMSANGMLAGRPAGLFIAPHPGNPRQPSSWYTTARPDLPFWYVNPALLQDAALTLARGESFEHRYLVITHDGDWAAERCRKVAEGFAGCEQ